MQIDNILWKIDQQPPPPQARTLSLKFKVIISVMLVLSSATPNQEFSSLARDIVMWYHFSIILINAELTVTMADSVTWPLGPCHRSEAGYTALMTPPSTNNTIPGLKRDLWPLQMGGKWLCCVYTESETIAWQTWLNVYCRAAWGGDFEKFDCVVMVTWCVYLVLDNFLVLKVECCKISGIVSNSVAASLGSHSPWHKTTEPLSWAPSWQHRDAPSWTQCALTKALYARPSAQTLLLDGSTGLTDRAIT